jgi:hypothetical protein
VGVLVLETDGSFVYHTAGWHHWRITSFTYRACDGLVCSSPAKVTIAIKTVPVANNDAYVTSINSSLSVPEPGVLGNDTGGGTLTATLESDLSEEMGTLTLYADGSFDYEPKMDYLGTASFTYRACDGTICSEPATVTIEVKDVPVAVDDDYEMPINTTLIVPAPGVLKNDSAPGGAALNAVLVTGVDPLIGTLNLLSTGGFSFTPVTGFTGEASFTYLACYEGICSEPATVTIAVKIVPTAAADHYQTAVNTELNVQAPGVLGNDNGGGAELTAVIETGLDPDVGELTLNRNGSLVFIPDEDWIGVTSFTYRACDGTICSEPATVTIAVKTVPTLKTIITKRRWILPWQSMHRVCWTTTWVMAN